MRMQTRFRQLLPILCVGVLGVAVAVGWGALAPRRLATAPASGRTAAQLAAHVAGTPAGSDVPGRAAAPDTAADRAIRLQALLGQHMVLAADVMRSRIRGDDDFAQAANAALTRNTDGMSELVGQSGACA